MKLNYKLPEECKRAFTLSQGETIRYCVPYDLPELANDTQELLKNGFLVVTEKRMLVLQGEKLVHEFLLQDCEKIRCETLVGNGVMIATVKGEEHLVVRFSMRHISRLSYVAKGAELLMQKKQREVVSEEPERYCERCGRALPGTNECPYCDGKFVTLKKFLVLCEPYKFKMLGIALFMTAASTLHLSLPEVQKRFIDGVLRDKTGDLGDVFFFVGIMLALTLAQIAVNVIKNWWCVSLGARISMDLRAKLYQKVQTLSLSFQQKRKPGELMNRISQDTRRIRHFMQEVFGHMFSSLFTMVGALIVMLSMNWKLTLLSTVFVYVVIFISILWRKKMRRMWRMQWVKEDRVSNRLQDVISGMRVVKSFGREESEAERFTNLTEDFAKLQKKNETFYAVFSPLMTFTMGLGVYLATYFGGLNVLSDKMTNGELLQFITYTMTLYGPLSMITNLPRQIMQVLTSLERIYDILDEEPDIKNSEKAETFEIQGDIEFDDVSFGYRSYEPVLENISLSVKKGEMIGLVGASGTGKSTMINLLMRLYDPDEGMIRVDGRDLRDVEMECLHSQIGVVLQETFLFSGTILNNIRFAKQNATFEEVVRAAKAANAHDFIIKTPDGYNTYVGEHGHNLSGGERQRIAIARAILNNPKLLILDEATSALDTESEYMIQQALDRLIQGRTTFAIAHRLSTLRNANRLVVIDGHRIAEVGTHNELLEKKGIYYGLVTAQLQMQGEKPEMVAQAE